MREQKLAGSLQALAVEAFPDNPDVVWLALAFEHYRDVTYVEAEAEPATVGYPSFRFVVTWPADEPEVLGCYCLVDGRWELLFGEDPLAEASAAIELPEQGGGCALVLLVIPLLVLLLSACANEPKPFSGGPGERSALAGRAAAQVTIP